MTANDSLQGRTATQAQAVGLARIGRSFIIQGPHYYTLMTRGKKETGEMTRFPRSGFHLFSVAMRKKN